MERVKCNLLDHIDYDIVRNGGLFLCDAGLYEYSHIIFKQSHARTSKRRSYAMDDSIGMVGRKIREDVSTNTRKPQKHMLLDETEQEMLSLSRRKACQEDKPV